MTHAAFVGSFEGFENLLRDLQRVFDRNWPASHAIGERLPLDELEDEVLRARLP
jgi:hypothetical protein